MRNWCLRKITQYACQEQNEEKKYYEAIVKNNEMEDTNQKNKMKKLFMRLTSNRRHCVSKFYFLPKIWGYRDTIKKKEFKQEKKEKMNKL